MEERNSDVRHYAGGGASSSEPLLPGKPFPPPLLCRQEQEEEEEEQDGEETVGAVDWLGRPLSASRRPASCGGWKAASFLLGSQTLHFLAISGCTVNMVIFLVREMQKDTASAATAITTWLGTSYLSSIVGGALGDTFCGRLWTSVFYQSIYILGLIMFAMFSSIISAEARPSSSHVTLFYVALYIMGLGTASLAPNLVSLGADQFDSPKQISAFFSLYMASTNVGMLISGSVLSYVENEGLWKLGFSLSAGIGILGFILFLAGMPSTRQLRPGRNPLSSIAHAIRTSFRSPKAYARLDPSMKDIQKASSFRWLDRGVSSKLNPSNRGMNSIIQLLPFWVCGILMAAVMAQKGTLFVLQGYTMENRAWANIKFPSSSMGLFGLAVVAVGAPAYTLLVEPYISRESRGTSSIMRMGAGLVVAICMFCTAAAVEARRLQIAREQAGPGYVDDKGDGVIVPMSIFWLIPQYVLDGCTVVLFSCGHMDFSYSYSPPGMRSLATAFSLSGFALGNYLSSFLVKLVTSFTPWISNDLNQGHLDYFYWLLAGLLLLTFGFFVVSSKWVLSLQSNPMKDDFACNEENLVA